MKKFLKIMAYFASGLIALIIIAVAYISLALPNVGPAPEDLKVEITPEKVAHGKYLANHVMLCADCHSVRDFSLFSGPPVPGTEMTGGERFDQTMGFPGVFISANITPFGIGDWTDGEIFRLITTGVRKDGSPIFPVMPYHSYGLIDQEDIEAVIAYLRTLEPVETAHPKSKADFPFNFILRTMPAKAQLTKKPDPSDLVAYGGYLVNASACADCHTKFENGSYTGERLAGGRSFEMPNGTLTTSNLTPHPSGLGNWTKEMFVQRFKMYGEHYVPEKVGADDFQTIMPWMMYAGMRESDLEAIFAYLQSLPPVENYIEKFKPNI
ncbi:c-type cytochrome [Cecembia calidifontis]|uniref:Mono/diheme cytochrome c family protein n=1 Tax=Cecembia calidifontis TaxID=1187080 RepID=A0A4Q7P904_9BACT|nr:cytochrome c [Cecembia calidifontis]RZS96595.1 mono/diheme cytochrome c family protein [Cecembia calidifontis]